MDEATYMQIGEQASSHRNSDPRFARWAAGYGAITHSDLTQVRIWELMKRVSSANVTGDGLEFFDLLMALDHLTNAGMWLVVHETYAKNVYLDGRDLAAADFKPRPEGHTGGALNMVPAYAGFLGINALTGTTRGWLMGQGHCVAAIDSLNLLVDNLTPAHAARYAVTDEGLTRYVRDYYSYRIGEDGNQDSPLGSHVNANTAGGLSEGGYLGFAELQYVHMTLPGERLVTFLSDGAFEEQRGSDWAPRWWRGMDCGLVSPIMIKNGRRIDQRTTMSQQGGVRWFVDHLRLNNFDPIIFDGRDPAAFLWAIFEIEERLQAATQAVREGRERYPVPLPYGVAVAPKGAGFIGEGTNLAHNLPLPGNPSQDPYALQMFNQGAKRLWVSPGPLQDALSKLQQHEKSGRIRERDHPLAHREVNLRETPAPPFQSVPSDLKLDSDSWTRISPMAAIDGMFASLVRLNPHLPARVGNPDEMRSNRLLETLELLKFRVTDPEPGIPEAIDGSVITALNEEAVASAALANKGGINLTHTYEAFGVKMLGVIRQEIIFARNCNRAGRKLGWFSVPVVLTSHTWENGKNEHSHQDPTLAEALIGEPSHISRVMFPPDFNTAAAVMESLCQTRGQIWTIVAAKSDAIPNLFSGELARRLVVHGGVRVPWAGFEGTRPGLVIAAIGSYQLLEVLQASSRLAEKRVKHSVVCLLEPGRFRLPRSEEEDALQVPPDVVEELFPASAPCRLFVTHTRPEPILGLLGPLHTGSNTSGLGYVNEGGTLDQKGMLFVNRCSWAHIVLEAARLLRVERNDLLTDAEIDAAHGRRTPHGVLFGAPGTS